MRNKRNNRTVICGNEWERTAHAVRAAEWEVLVPKGTRQSPCISSILKYTEPLLRQHLTQ